MIRLRQRIFTLRHQGKDGYQDALLRIAAGDQPTIAEWSKPLTAEERQERNEAIFDLWLGGTSERDIAQKGSIAPVQVHRITTMLRQSKCAQLEHLEQPPIYNVWTYSLCDPRFGQKYPGQIPGQQAEAQGLRTEGLSQTAIAKELRVTQQTISLWLNKSNGAHAVAPIICGSAPVTNHLLPTPKHPCYLTINERVEDFTPPDGLRFPKNAPLFGPLLRAWPSRLSRDHRLFGPLEGR